MTQSDVPSPAPDPPDRTRLWRFIVITSFVTIVALVAAAQLPAFFTSGAKGRPDDDAGRPNIVLILTDDQRWDSLSAMPAVQDLLVAHGVTFANSFVTTPLCCPSRASLLTGLYSHHTGVLDGSADNAPGGAPAFDDRSTVATWLDDAGYATSLVGKYLNDYNLLPTGYVPPGWDDWHAVAQPSPQIRYYGYQLNENGQIVDYGNSPDDYSTTVLEQRAISFVHDADDPFFLYFAPIAPHPPALPAPEDEGRFADLAPPKIASFGEADVSDKPWAELGKPFTAERRAAALDRRESMLESLLSVDRAVKSIVEAVAARGLLEETYFVFTSDNGFLLGEHRLTGKIWPYEESLRVPLVIRPPALDGSRTDSHMVLNIDLASTLAQLAGVRPGIAQDGQSLVPLLAGRDPPWRTAFLAEFLGYAPTAPRYVAIRTLRYLYVEYRNGWRELYDLRADPLELDNLAEDPARHETLADLSERLGVLFSRPATPQRS